LKISRDELLSFVGPISLTWMAAILLGIVYWNFRDLWVAPVKTPLPQLNMGPLAMAIFGAVMGIILGPGLGQLLYTRRSDRSANFVSFVALVLFGVIGVLRYGYSSPILPLNEAFSDDFTASLIVVVLLCSVFPLLHYIVKPDPKAIRPFPAAGRKRRKRARRRSAAP
jgi:hypothetical protein